MSDQYACRLLLGGRVQGVGFRPFVYRLAATHTLTGWVRNRAGDVEILIQGDRKALDAFQHDVLHRAPPLARPRLLERSDETPATHSAFLILPSEAGTEQDIHVPPDYFTCDDCLTELNDPRDRRYRYPFINCTQCGPRYTIIDGLPYDRAKTSMAHFTLCPHCQAEYENPLDRRFHAEPVACPACGPQLSFHRHDAPVIRDSEAALRACVEALHEGAVVAVKGIGGYHLLCDAQRDAPIRRLRCTKPRPHKPLAVMVPISGDDGLAEARRYAEISTAAADLLRDPVRPVVLVPHKTGSSLSRELNPGLRELGLMLPYSPLHALILQDFGGPLVATSANLSGEPVLTEAADVEIRLAEVAEAFLHHNRPIRRPADDPVYRIIAGRGRTLRLGRGNAPLELELPVPLKRPVLAVGAHLKNTIALGWGNRAVVSPHIGNMGTLRSHNVFRQICDDLQALYGVKAEQVSCDAHPDYTNSRWANASGLGITRVFHHHAHASALAGEYGLPGTLLVFTWDGTGLGEDGTLWGGETLLGQPGAWRRVASFRPFHLPGGERASRDPWRSALALCWESGIDWRDNRHDNAMPHHAWQRGVNAPPTSAVGRLFDAAAALTGLVKEASFDGQAPMWLEAIAELPSQAAGLPLIRDEDGLWRSDWAPLLDPLQDPTRPLAERAGLFHATLAQTLLDQALTIREEHGIAQAGLTGGVFQNRLLTERAKTLLENHGFQVLIPERIPCNDAGISYGQLIETAARQAADQP